jgi:hypothetical protein
MSLDYSYSIILFSGNEKVLLTEIADTAAFVAHFLGSARSDVTRREVAKARILSLQIIIATTPPPFRYKENLFMVHHLNEFRRLIKYISRPEMHRRMLSQGLRNCSRIRHSDRRLLERGQAQRRR